MKRRTFLAGLTVLVAGIAAGPLLSTASIREPLPNFGPRHHIESVWREGATTFLRVRFQSHSFVLKSSDGRYWRTT
jgi:hypothetical protein